MPVYDAPLQTNDQSLERVIHAGLPVVLVVWDSRQGIDRGLDDVLRQIAKTEAGKLLVARIDAANNPAAAARWKNVSLPAVMLYRDARRWGMQNESRRQRLCVRRAHMCWGVVRVLLPPTVGWGAPLSEQTWRGPWL